MRFIPPSDYSNHMINGYKTYTDNKVVELQKQIDELKEQVHDLKEEQYDEELYDILRTERNEIAKESETKPYFILTNETLKELSRKKPITLDTLKETKGIKDIKAQRYGERLVQIIQKYLKETK